MATRRYNPDGSSAGRRRVSIELPCSSVLDATVACRVELTLQSEACARVRCSRNRRSSRARRRLFRRRMVQLRGARALGRIDGLNASITGFPATEQLFASPVAFQDTAAATATARRGRAQHVLHRRRR